MKKVKIYSKTGCHLCEIAIDKISSVKEELDFILDVELIDTSIELQQEFGEQVPVILIDGKIHDYWRVDLERFIKALKS